MRSLLPMLAGVAGGAGVSAIPAVVALGPFGAALAAGLAGTAVAFGAARALGQRESSVDELYAGIRVNPGKPDEPIPIAYGSVRVGGPLAYRNTIDSDNKRLWTVTIWSEGEIESVDELYFNNRSYTDFQEDDDDKDNIEHVGSYTGTDNQSAHDRLVSESEEWTTAHRLRGLAYTAARIKYNNNGPNAWPNGFPLIEADIQGIKCFDPRTQQTAYTRNPALVWLDYMTNERYGRGIPYSRIDEASVIEAADYCDEKVVYPNGKQYTRYKCDIVLDPKKTIRDNVLAILSSCRGMAIYAGGMWTILIDRPTTAHSVRLDDSILIGAVLVDLGDKKDRPNKLRISYVDRNREFEPNQVIVKSDAMLEEDNGVVNEVQVNLPGTSTRRDAKRIGSQELKQYRQSMVISGRMTLGGLVYAVGDVVAIDSALNGWDGKLFRISRLDLFNDDTVGFEAREYDPSVYTLDVDDTDEIPDTNLPDPFIRPRPRNLTLTAGTDELLKAGDGTIHSRIHVSWDYNDEKRASVLRTFVDWKVSGETGWVSQWVDGDTTETYLQPVVDGTSYDVRARSMNLARQFSGWVTPERIEVDGKSEPPTRPTGFRIILAADGRKIFRWEDTERDIDWAGWRIYYLASDDFPNALRLHEGLITESPHLSDDPYAGFWWFWLVQVDTSGNESEPRKISMDLTGVQVGDAVWREDARALGWPGTVSGGSVIDMQVIATDSGSWDDLGATTWDQWFHWGGGSPNATVTYTHTTIDLGSALLVTPSASGDGSDSLTFEVRYSTDGASWSSWAAPGAAISRQYWEFRVTAGVVSDPIAYINSASFQLLE